MSRRTQQGATAVIKQKHWVMILVLGTALALPCFAQAPTQMNYQGRLTDNTPGQTAISDTLSMEFRIYGSLAGTDLLWTEAWGAVVVNDGIFSVLLGSNGSPLAASVFTGGTTRFLEITVGIEILAPRQQLGSVPFSLQEQPGNEYNSALNLNGTSLELTDGDGMLAADLSSLVDDADADPTNEYNTNLLLNGSSLELTDGGGTLAADLSSLSVGDNLGNHTATTTLNMFDNNITNVGDVVADADYGVGLVGLYSSTRYRNVYAMGTSYRLAADGTSPGNLYGIAYTHTNVGGESIPGLGHQTLFMSAGDTRSAIGDGIWTKYDVTGNRFVDQNDSGYYVNPAGASNFNDITADIVIGTQVHSSTGFTVDGQTVIDDGAGWHRSLGATGWYNQTYGGGIFMQDSTWVRVYNNKSFFVPSNLDVNGTALLGYERISVGGTTTLNTTCFQGGAWTCYTGSATASCSAGKVVLGGGCVCSGVTDSVCYSYPNGTNGWTCQNAEDSSGQPFTVYAICARLGN
jgi:hypothetical protein